MDFRTLAAQQSQTIDELNQRLTARDKEIGQLQYRLAEVTEQLKTRSTWRQLAVDDHEVQKLRTRAKIAEDRATDLGRQLQDAGTRREDNLRHFSKVETELKQQVSESQVQNASRRAFQQHLDGICAERDNAKRTLATVQRQFEEEKRANRRREFAHDMDKAINRDGSVIARETMEYK